MRGALVTGFLLTAALAGAPAAFAAKVSVEEAPLDYGTTKAVLSYEAAPGEDNHLTIRAVRTENAIFDLEVLDSSAPIDPGHGCIGGGAPDVVVTCKMHQPKAPDHGTCHFRNCSPPTIPASGWDDTMSIQLGDGENAFDGGSFTGRYAESVTMDVVGGPGADRITTGGGYDKIDPGVGSDDVHSGDGDDEVETTATADGPDLYDLGPGGDGLSYGRRTTPVTLEGTISGEPGERDRLVGVECLTTGSGADILEANPETFCLKAGPGNDLLKGGPNAWFLDGGAGNDTVEGSAGHDILIGGIGDDTLEGGPGHDELDGAEGNDLVRGRGGHDTVGGGTGDDVVNAGGGRDWIGLSTGNDRAYGGGGEDVVYAGDGNDLVRGGRGHDLLELEGGDDRAYGGPGLDQLGGGPGRDSLATPDDGRDLADCGPGRDHAVVNPWDRPYRCEVVKLVDR